jgi:hypothetical protein
VLDLLGIAAPAGVEGASLVGLMRAGGVPADGPVYAEVALGTPPSSTYAVWLAARQWIVADDGAAQAFETGADPGEQHPLTGDGLLAIRREALQPYRARAAAQSGVRAPAMDEEKGRSAARARLRAVGRRARRRAAIASALPDTRG